MRYGYCTTRDERRKHHTELANLMRQWRKLSTPDLLSEVQKLFPNVTVLLSDVTEQQQREELLQFLVIDHVEKMI